MIVFNSIGISLKNIPAPVDFTGGIGSSLQQEIIVTIHTGNQTSPQLGCIQRVHEYHLFSFCQGGGRRKHHLEIVFVVFKLFKQCAPESDVVIAFYVSDDTSAGFFRIKLMGGIEIRRSQIIS